ncbi:tyrosine tRNA ligase [Ordospora pajunii]|uniref:tyrosine tRNA ligase n=1 Tax=Ordospora pajunii TaxID=3039483 RepID=UPI0029528B12|nr:tyrosine tRNA ligase [Ordospora pajunii]KAH9412243.1 tyrosine tRNA ligase [Ordospora pajunii]
MSVQKRVDLMTRNLQEVIGREELVSIAEKRDLSVYWGTAITGKPHIAYLVPLLKIKDFVDAGCRVKILFADIHGFLDNLKAPIEKIKHRCVYYERLIKACLRMLCVELEKIEFVRGSEYQRSPEYVMDLYRILAITNEHDAKKAGAQVVRQVENPMISSLVYPAMQALDEEHLHVDVQFGGVDQRKIFTYARKYLPMLGYAKRIHLMSPMVPGLNSEKMSSSEEVSKIDMMDSSESIMRKMKKSFCEEGNKENGLLKIFLHIIFPVFCMHDKEVWMEIRGAGRVVFERYEDLEDAFGKREVHPMDLKEGAARMIDEVIGPVRSEMMEQADVLRQAYD